MKVGILSDTHDRTIGIDGAFAVFQQQTVDHVIHCGDWTKITTLEYLYDKARSLGLPVTGVLGNNDRDVEAFHIFSESHDGITLVEGVLRLEHDGKQIAVYHGHHQPTLRKLLVEPLDLLCLGHSHKPRYDRLDEKTIINPGSTAFAIPRQKGWQSSVAVYDTATHEAEFFYYS